MPSEAEEADDRSCKAQPAQRHKSAEDERQVKGKGGEKARALSVSCSERTGDQASRTRSEGIADCLDQRHDRKRDSDRAACGITEAGDEPCVQNSAGGGDQQGGGGGQGQREDQPRRRGGQHTVVFLSGRVHGGLPFIGFLLV